MRRSAALVVAVAVLAAGGCGRDDTQLAEQSVRGLIAAMERADGRAACDRLSQTGVSELLAAAVRRGTGAEPLDAADVDHCAVVAARVASGADGLERLRLSPVGDVSVEGDRATVRTQAGAYELEELDGRWLLSRFEPLSRVLTGGSADERPVHLSIVRPKLTQPALDPARAGRTDDPEVELTGTLQPADATLEARPAGATRAELVEAGDGRFRVRLRLVRGRNEIVLVARAPGRSPTERAVRLTLE